jgi:hypothetical protein
MVPPKPPAAIARCRCCVPAAPVCVDPNIGGFGGGGGAAGGGGILTEGLILTSSIVAGQGGRDGEPAILGR